MRIVASDPAELIRALLTTRRRTLTLVHAWAQALPDLKVPLRPTLNLPLWEWGHVAWFQAWWIGRNRQRHLGVDADPHHERLASSLPQADSLYDSSRVAHPSRWDLALPSFTRTLEYLEITLEETLDLLRSDARAGHDLYFFHLVLRHEDMHNEASVYMAQALGLSLPPEGISGRADTFIHAQPQIQPFASVRQLRVPSTTLTIGHTGTGFCFDNEWGAHVRDIPAFEIDAEPVSWSSYVDFLGQTGHPRPPHLRLEGGQWMCRRFAQWEPLALHEPACHVSAQDAQAWCDWAGRALPTEVQWEAASRQGLTHSDFLWGKVWEWTASVFEPYPGFRPHPYEDYSAPWFGSHRVLRGASVFTSANIVSPTYRNFFLPDRTDVPAGFRTVNPIKD